MATRPKKIKQPDIDASIDATPASTKITPIILTGYQYNDQGTFIGVYKFEKNMDKEEVHMPRGMTLQPPPTTVSVDQEIFFDGQQWVTRNLTLSGFPDRELPPEQDETQEDDQEPNDAN
jgi:hypothetical protein